MTQPTTDQATVAMLHQKLGEMNCYFEFSYDEDYTFSMLGALFEEHGYQLTHRCIRVDPWSNRGTYEYYTVPVLPEVYKSLDVPYVTTFIANPNPGQSLARDESDLLDPVFNYPEDDKPFVPKSPLCLYCDDLYAREGSKFCSDVCQKAFEAEMPF